MRFHVVTIFPELFPGPLASGVTGKAIASGNVVVHPVDLRTFTADRHRTVDDTPYGGGAGMVMKPEPLFEAVEAIRAKAGRPVPVVLMTPQGEPLRQRRVEQIAAGDEWIVVCGRYRGVDQRFRDACVDLEISIGDFVLSGGEIPAHVLMDAAIRLLPGVLGNEDSSQEDSFARSGLDGAAYYTRPSEYRGMKVPDVLLEGHHGRIAAWREGRAREETRRRRPDLLEENGD